MKKEMYASPSVWELDLQGDEILCASTEGYVVGEPIGEDDWN